MKTILLACLVACGTNGGDAHLVGTCGSGWAHAADFASCEQACEEPPANQVGTSGPMCAINNSEASCVYFEYDGTKGCCIPTIPKSGDAIVFYECK